jgi:hypothetical protein
MNQKEESGTGSGSGTGTGQKVFPFPIPFPIRSSLSGFILHFSSYFPEDSMPSFSPARGWRDPLRLVIVLWLAVAVAAALRTLARPTTHTVFPVFALASSHWWSDQPLYILYEPLDHFRYPPGTAVALTAFAALGLRAGGILWTWLGMAVYFAGLWRFARDVAPGLWTRGRLAALLALGCAGALRGFWNAQSNALAVGLLLLGAAELACSLAPGKDRRRWRIALLLGGTVAIKLTPLAPVLLLCALWPRRLVGGIAAVLMASFLLPFLTKPPDVVLGHYRDWLTHLTTTGAGRWLGFRDGWTVWMVIRHAAEGASGPLQLRAPIDSLAYRMVQMLTGLGVLAWCLWLRRRGLEGRPLIHATLGMGLAWLMLFGPAVEHATYVFLTPMLAWAVVDREAWPRGRPLLWAAFCLIMVLGWGALSRPWQDRLPVLLLPLPIGCALFAAWLGGYARTCLPSLPPAVGRVVVRQQRPTATARAA